MMCWQCGRTAVHAHHCVYEQELRRLARTSGANFNHLMKDKRNLMPLCFNCHFNHHARTQVIALKLLHADVFDFAREVLGAGRAYEYLRRHYRGPDVRSDELLAEWVAEREVA